MRQVFGRFLILILVSAFILFPTKKCFAVNVEQINEYNTTGKDQKIQYAPEDAEISSTKVSLYGGPGEKMFVVEIHTNKPVHKNSIIVPDVFYTSQNDVDKVKKDLKIAFPSQGLVARTLDGSDRSDVFYIGINTEQFSPEEQKPYRAMLILVALNTAKEFKVGDLYVFYFFSEQYEKLPVPLLSSLFTGNRYLIHSRTCDIENPNFQCQLVEKIIGKQEIRFDNSFAQKYPIAYILSLFSLFVLGIIIFGFLILSYLLTLILQRKPWGVAFDAKTLQPIGGAIVRIFDKEKNKLLETKVTGKDGRFTFLPGRGDYYLRVIKPGYQFPSKILTHFHHPAYYHLYHGEEFLIKNDSAMFITNIPLDPEHKPSLIIRPMIFQRIFYALARLRWPLVIIFLILTGLNLLAYYLWKIEFIPIKWLAIGIAPIFLLELYFWWQGRRVRILKGFNI